MCHRRTSLPSPSSPPRPILLVWVRAKLLERVHSLPMSRRMANRSRSRARRRGAGGAVGSAASSSWIWRGDDSAAEGTWAWREGWASWHWRWQGGEWWGHRRVTAEAATRGASAQRAAEAPRRQRGSSTHGQQPIDDFEEAAASYDLATRQELTKQRVSRRTFSLSKAFQNYRRVVLNALKDWQLKKRVFYRWRRSNDMNGDTVLLSDFIWADADMENFLQTYASYEAQLRSRK